MMIGQLTNQIFETSMSHLMVAFLNAIGIRKRKLSTLGFDTVFFETGNRNKPTLLLLHGFTDSKLTFIRLALRMRTRFHILIPDSPGFGETKQNIHRYTDEFYLDWAHDFLGKAGTTGPVHIIGNSLGGALALNIGINRPELASSLTLMNAGGACDPDNLVGVYEEFDRGQSVFDINHENDLEELINRLTYRKITLPPLFKRRALKRYQDKGSHYQNILAELYATSAGTDTVWPPEDMSKSLFSTAEMAKIKVPTFILWGSHDRLLPAELGVYIRDNIPNSQLHILKECGHMPHLEKPASTAMLLGRFLKQVG